MDRSDRSRQFLAACRIYRLTAHEGVWPSANRFRGILHSLISTVHAKSDLKDRHRLDFGIIFWPRAGFWWSPRRSLTLPSAGLPPYVAIRSDPTCGMGGGGRRGGGGATAAAAVAAPPRPPTQNGHGRAGRREGRPPRPLPSRPLRGGRYARSRPPPVPEGLLPQRQRRQRQRRRGRPSGRGGVGAPPPGRQWFRGKGNHGGRSDRHARPHHRYGQRRRRRRRRR